MSIYLVSYKPLCNEKQGKEAIEENGQYNFVDHSFRREPELESEYPGISSICRGRNFAPRLEEDDVIVYITVKGKHIKGINEKHWCITAILRVMKKCNSHDEASKWYLNQGLKIPSNCIVDGSNPLPNEYTALSYSRADEEKYRKNVTQYPQYLICEAEYKELKFPHKINDNDMKSIFNRIPPTQTPTTITLDELDKLRSIIR